MLKDDDTRSMAGMVAAATAVVAKQLPLRTAPPWNLSEDFRPSTPADLPRLFRRDGESDRRRVARLSSAALLYSVNKATTEHSSRILYGEERDLLNTIHGDRRDKLKTDRSCPHCRLLYGTLYEDVSRQSKRKPPIAVVSHSARVNVKFDPVTNISEARINNFQVIVPESVAMEMLSWSHPLRWAEPPGTLFRQCYGVDEHGGRPEELQGPVEKVIGRWEDRKEKFIYEDCLWPINESLRTTAENIIAIDDFARTYDDRSLNFTYRLQRSLRSNFGVAWERGGLDVDGGFYQALAVPVEEFADRVNEDVAEVDDETFPREPLTEIPIGQLRRRDVLELESRMNPGALTLLYNGAVSPEQEAAANLAYADLPVRPSKAPINAGTVAPQYEPRHDPDRTSRDEVVRMVNAVAGQLWEDWRDAGPFYVVNVSACKRLHFTIPENGPIELWHLLTWTAPAFLFTFLNNAICLAPHVLVGDKIKPHSVKG